MKKVFSLEENRANPREKAESSWEPGAREGKRNGFSASLKGGRREKPKA